MTDKDSGVIVGFCVIALVAIIIGPMLVIWALNQLFGFGIEITFWNWLATFILCGVVSPKPAQYNKS